ncbi:MAG: HAMP domain-containing sensor histidine kinase [Patescibacteria group bacterium]
MDTIGSEKIEYVIEDRAISSPPVIEQLDEKVTTKKISPMQDLEDEILRVREIQQDIKGIIISQVNTPARRIKHDINNFLSSFLGYAELIELNDIKYDEEKKKRMLAAYNKLLILYDKLRENLKKRIIGEKMSLIDDEKPILFELDYDRDSIGLLVNFSHKNNKVKQIDLDFQNNLSDKQIYTKLNINSFDRIMNNLLTNAVEALDKERGEIKCIISDLRSVVVDGNQLYIQISDNGRGISPENTDKIYDWYFSTKEGKEERGIGMSTVKDLVEKADGKIFVNSQEGKGTSFNILIPIVTK